jgi:hypothetical protein
MRRKPMSNQKQIQPVCLGVPIQILEWPCEQLGDRVVTFPTTCHRCCPDRLQELHHQIWGVFHFVVEIVEILLGIA